MFGPGRGAPPRPRGPAVRRATEYPDEPAYKTVITLTAGWYLLPVVLYVAWLMTVGANRQGSAAKDIAGSVPWLVTAVLLSLAVAGLLRWAIVGWRALTLSFAAAVIGAAVATIAHSLSL